MSHSDLKRRDFLRLSGGAVASTALLGLSGMQQLYAGEPGSRRPPNIILIYCDDMGYADLACYGGKNKTPNLDQMAGAGLKFNRYYAPSSVCSPSRAGTLTGCYPQRLCVNHVLFPAHKKGLNTKEQSIADVLKHKNYATMCAGKWHLGHLEKNMPGEFGFDRFYGIPYSNDMWAKNNFDQPIHHKENNPDLFIYENTKKVKEIKSLKEQGELTGDFTRESLSFIKENKDNPFFLYLAHPMPHVPLAASPKFKGKSGNGLYGDVMMELDWSVGEIRKALRQHKIANNTLLIFTSDNGPWLQYGNWGGNAKPWREGKTTSFEGGTRVPCLMEMPGTIPANQSTNEPVGGIDLMPSICALTGVPLPKRKIDGKNILPIMKNKPGATSPHDYLYFFGPIQGDLQAVSKGKWKLHYEHSYHPTEGKKKLKDGRFIKHDAVILKQSLYNLELDPGEKRDVSARHPKLVKELSEAGIRFFDDLFKHRRPRA